MGDYVRIDDGMQTAATVGDSSDVIAAVQHAATVFGSAAWAGDDKYGASFRNACPPAEVCQELGPPDVDGKGQPQNAAGHVEAIRKLIEETIPNMLHRSLESSSEQGAVVRKVGLSAVDD